MWFLAVRRLLPAALLLAFLSHSSTAIAQSDEQRAAARSLATEGATAFSQGRFQEAVDLFSRAETLVHAPPHLLFLARAHERLGQLVKAREAYLKIVKESLPSTAPKAFRDAQTAAGAEVQGLEPRIASLTVRIENGQGVADLVVTVDGTALPSVLVGLAQPIDPGTHRIEAGATGLRAQPESVTLAEGEKKVLVMKLAPAPGALAPGATAPAAAPADTAAPPPAAPVSGSPTTDAGTKETSGSGLRIGSYVALGVGALGLIGGTVFTLQSAGKRKDADKKHEECGGNSGCFESEDLSRQVDELDRDADTMKTFGIVGFAVGGVGVAAGVTMFLLSSGGDERKARSVEPWIGLGSAGVRGRF
jgi:hypothetical protein